MNGKFFFPAKKPRGARPRRNEAGAGRRFGQPPLNFSAMGLEGWAGWAGLAEAEGVEGSEDLEAVEGGCR